MEGPGGRGEVQPLCVRAWQNAASAHALLRLLPSPVMNQVSDQLGGGCSA